MKTLKKKLKISIENPNYYQKRNKVNLEDQGGDLLDGSQ